MGLVDLTVHIPSTSTPHGGQRPPPRWRTLEFKVYFTIAAIVIPIMIWIPVSLSSPSNPNYPYYYRKLSVGWIGGRLLDNSDAQYRSFRNNVPILAGLAALHAFAKAIYVRASRASLANNLYLLPFNLIFSICVLFGLHGFNVLKIGVILILNYRISKFCGGRKIGPLLTWAFNVAVLFAVEQYDDYPFGDIMPPLAVLDGFKGAYPRWKLCFNITMLRLISFNMDYYWSCRNTESHDHKVVGTHGMNEKQRQVVPHPEELYSFGNYVAYIIYAPLYLAGPIITFNDFMWQYRRPSMITRSTTLGYFVRFLASLLTMELILHSMYVVAIKDRKAWVGFTPAQISMVGFWNLIIVWLKLLLPWRFFRLWALVDGIDPPENMVRCMANNYSTLGFWRGWHRSYNLWIIRYIYIPVGGARNVFFNTLLVFTFVALWHDLTFRLLAWGWLVSFFVLPELLARWLLPESRYGAKPWYRHVCALGAVVNMLMMVVANLVGFVVGTDGIQYFLEGLLGSVEGVQFLVGAVCCMFVGAQLMFEYREEEMRKGIFRRC
ncbi:MBOAT-domain-containing protein [Pluteus cervinus]|uniref:MBOAT-domain-containing protein n=1 Tax=Pluteus cervinus TaxID=181527 RepID=A0ACD3A8F6_9AGAR|nr:MBOAT-domain-containing protein [Pluteus cervinus]